VYVGEPGGENLDVGAANENKDTAGKVRFQPGDVVSVPKELAERLDASWDTQGSNRGKAALQKAKTSASSEDSSEDGEIEAGEASEAEGGDDS
jgi:hypothetical protein